MPRHGYRFVNHTADVEFVSYGGSVDELFTNAFLALFDTMSYLDKVSSAALSHGGSHNGDGFGISEKADSAEELAWLALQDVLSKADANGVSPFRVPNLKVEEKGGTYLISARVEGISQRPEYRKFDVKGVSQYRLKITKKSGRYSMSVVLDV